MTPHDERILAPKNKPVSDPAVLHEFHISHWHCQMCGRACDGTAHHIIGGRGGRSDELCNLLYCCWLVCHHFADQSRNLGAVLKMKERAGELDAAGRARLEALNGHPLPDGEIPLYFVESFRANRPELTQCQSAPNRGATDGEETESRSAGN